jgi:hypothetical protein
MKIIRIAHNQDSPEKPFYDLDERRHKEHMTDQEYKNALLEYYEKYAHQSDTIDDHIMKMMKEFKDNDFVMSVLYEDLYNKTKLALTEQFQEIRLEKDKLKKIQKLMAFYRATHPNAKGIEVGSVGYYLKKETIEAINAYINKEAINWIK